MSNDLMKKSNCLTCNCEIDFYQSHISKKNGKRYYSKNKPARKYCSDTCAGKSKRSVDVFICDYCDEEFLLKHYNQKFCSQSCAGNYNQNCKRVRSWEKRKTPYSPKKITKIYNCKTCGVYSNNYSYCDKCWEERENARAKRRYVSKKKGSHILKSVLIHMSGGCCGLCGYKEHKSSLVFHHRNDQDKLFTLDVSSLMKKPIGAVIDEYSKCDLLCHNCHADLHQEERTKNVSDSYKTTREKYMNRKMDCISSMGGRCSSCSLPFFMENLQSASFHHTRDKAFELNCMAFGNKTDEKIKEELAKCTLLCMNCHMAIPRV